MRSFIRQLVFPVALGLGALGLVSCGDQSPTELARTAPRLQQNTGVALVECPTSRERSATQHIGPEGGSVSVWGAKMVVPPGAVLEPTRFDLSIPASQYLEISVTANGAEHFQFERAVSISIAYSRCSRGAIAKGALSAWYIHPASKALLEHMGGTDDKLSRTVTFATDHLSEYAIAN